MTESQPEPAPAGANSQSPPEPPPVGAGGDAEQGEQCNWLLPPGNTQQGLAINILAAYCAACHTPTATTPSAIGPADVLDLERMIAEGYLVDCSADSSVIIRVMRSNEMPPPGYFGFGVFQSDLDSVIQYIELRCSDEEKACAVAPDDPGCTAVLAAREDRRCRR